MSEEPKRVGARGGGQLNSGGNIGNRYGAGRKKNEVRATVLAMADDLVLPYIEQILKGEKIISDVNSEGVGFLRKPKSHETRWAADRLLQYSLAPTVDVGVDSENKPILVMDL